MTLPSSRASPPTKRHLSQLQTLASGSPNSLLRTPYSSFILFSPRRHQEHRLSLLLLLLLRLSITIVAVRLSSRCWAKFLGLEGQSLGINFSFFFFSLQLRKIKHRLFLSFRLSASHRLSPPSAQAAVYI